ncbi:RNA polymerase sigma factor [Emticicia sp. 21SJ11W-3]|uniref:RNA polymerase sigma factor n=1 Tax=Emticicia sp. 21SJ11W-3 TaxID=2916755 RepID=UPI00209E61B0|nr:RNA polymerase sigma factor [Emticicia sp. 21SJ11W-3]UTA70333.1 RNA polymerase sigma factor [Emticicia sp. 21SJ11W-3]
MATTVFINKHADLVEQCKRGESKAQYELYRHYSKAMFNVCMRILNHVGEAEDVLQEAFIDAFAKIGDFRQQATFGVWLKQIVVNKAINHLRSRRVELVNIDEYGIGGDGYDIADYPDTNTYTEDNTRYEVERIRRAMEQLPEGFRVVLSLYLFEGYDHEEIGNILGISETTSRTQYMRAKKRLLEIVSRQLF